MRKKTQTDRQTAEVAERLAAKHLSREKNVPTSCEAFQSLSLSRLEFFKTLRNTPKGSGCGPSGWKYEHLKALVCRSTTAEGLFSVCDLIAQGKIPPAIHEVISSSRLIASPKEIGDVRPIAIGECLRRLTAKMICIQKKGSFNSLFPANTTWSGCQRGHGASDTSCELAFGVKA